MCAWIYRTDDHRRRIRYQHQQSTFALAVISIGRLDDEALEDRRQAEGMARTFFNRRGEEGPQIRIDRNMSREEDSMEGVFNESGGGYRYDRERPS